MEDKGKGVDEKAQNEQEAAAVDDTVDALPSAPPSVPEEQARARKRRLPPKYALPSSRLKLEKQLEALLHYASESSGGKQPVSYARVAELLTVDQTAVSAANQFWADSKMLLEQKRGIHLPSPELVEWAHAYRLDPPSAWRHLNGKFREAWYGDWAQKKLQAVGTIQRDQLVKGLALVAGGDFEETETGVKMLVDVLVESGFLVETQPGVLSFGNASSPAPKPLGRESAAPLSAPAMFPEAADLEHGAKGQEVVHPQTIGVTVEVNTSNWPVDDVIRLLEYLKTGKDPKATNP